MRAIASKRKVVAAAVLLFLAGCANVSKEEIGTAIGVVAGAVIGAKVGGEKGMVIGAALGGLIGNRVGAHLDEQDRQKLQELERIALERGTGGSFVTNKTKARVTVAASASSLESRQEFILPASLKPHTLVMVDPQTVHAYVDTPVYNNINEGERPKLVIRKDVPMRVAAWVHGQNWAVVGDGNIGLGYVPRRYLDPQIASARPAARPVAAAPAAPAASGARRPAARTPAPAMTARADTPPTVSKEQYEQEMASLYAAYKPRSSGTGGPVASPAAASAAAPAPAVQVVQVATECKTVQRTVEGGGESTPLVERVKYCKEPPKGWQTQTA